MDQQQTKKQRHTYRWTKQARDLVSDFMKSGEPRTRSALRSLISRLTELTGHPRHACSRFVRQCEAVSCDRRPWTKAEKQKLLDLVSAHPLPEVANQMRRSLSSIRSMLHRLGASATMGKDWFTKYTLAEALHIRPDQIQKWMDAGLLKYRQVETGTLTRQIIDADAFAEFCQQHRDAVVGRRIDPARLDFVQNYVFPSSHSDLLPVRDSKKERSAFEKQKTNNEFSVAGDDLGEEAIVLRA